MLCIALVDSEKMTVICPIALKADKNGTFQMVLCLSSGKTLINSWLFVVIIGV
jgi:hypothetical protein